MAKKISSVSIAGEEDWQAESDLRTMMEAEAIEKNPKRIKAVKELAAKKMMAMAALASESAKD